MNAKEEPASADPSPPAAPLAVRMVVFLLLLALAVAAIWWIDRGAMLTNSGGATTHG